MADLQTIAIGIVQANALLLPVILLLVRFAIGPIDERTSLEKYESRMGVVALISMVMLSISGLFGAAGVLELNSQELILFLSVIGLFFGFAGVSIFTGLTVWHATRPS